MRVGSRPRETRDRTQTLARASLLVVALLTSLMMSAPVLGQRSRGPEPSGGQTEVLVAQGELVRVDPSSKTFVITNAQGAEMPFRYTDQTKVSGADQTVIGHDDRRQLTVRYTKQQQDNVATEIEVQKKS